MTAVGNVVAVKMSDPDKVGLATSTFYIGLDIGIGFGPALIGIIVPSIGYRTMYLGSGILMLICILLYSILHGQRHRHRKIEEH